MKNSYQFFENRDCKYFPCHEGAEEFNCLFCFCPLYRDENCPGNYSYCEVDGTTVKDCSKCVFSHRPEGYDAIIQILSQQTKQD